MVKYQHKTYGISLQGKGLKKFLKVVKEWKRAEEKKLSEGVYNNGKTRRISD